MKSAALGIALAMALVTGGFAEDRHIRRTAPRELLERTARLYEKAGRGCVLAARITRYATGADTSSESYSGFQVMRSESSARLEPLTREAVWGVSGARAFLFLRDRKDYLEAIIADDDGDRIRRQIDYWFQRLGGKFANWPRLDAEFTLVGEEQLRTAEGRKPCAVVEIRPRDARLRWTERVWIDTGSGQIWKAFLRSPASRTSLQTDETVTWEKAHVGAVPEESMRFTPPAGFHRLDYVPFPLLSVKP